MREKPKQIDYSISTFVYFLSGKSFKVCPPPSPKLKLQKALSCVT